ncbi:ubiquinone biosynthesis accessory factor UbiJ [Nitrosomonas halophila]|uniref:Ubiquinone biosynthesis protein UbiJ n=1 Tax=Nitrosomonas halophila TaxID=44576 RepID=A0A1H3J7Q8_9PROT|nr:SCP2 sterol-binding domain-containing protein [Nitrosomonas halophila]SDY36003.1 ubiquinone biosynthesis protein UbiJ [Nitrosomonas halophila]
MLTHILTPSFNRLIDKTAWARERLQSHAGQSVRLTIESLLTLNFRIESDGHVVSANHGEAAAATLTLTPDLLGRLAANDRQAFREISLSGDPTLTETLLYLGKILPSEIEADLSMLIGDALSHRAVQVGQGLLHWHLQSALNVSQALARFLADEEPVIASRNQLERLASGAETLQQQVARLETRVHALAIPHKPQIETNRLSLANQR